MIIKINSLNSIIMICLITMFSCGCLSDSFDGGLNDPSGDSPLYKITDPSFSDETLPISHSWRYDNKNMELNSVYSKDLVSYYESLSHGREDVSGYMTTTYDKQIISDLAHNMNQYGLKYHWTKEQKIMNAVAFVNSVSRDADNTDHYPTEILVYGSSGNKDSAILSVRLLSEMGYDCVLIDAEGHYEIGIQDENGQGQYIEYNDTKYFLTEPQDPYFIGYVLPEYRNKTAKIYRPETQEAVIEITDCTLTPAGNNRTHRFYNISADVVNCGPGATNVTLYLYALSDPDTVCRPDCLIENISVEEGQHVSVTATLKIPNDCAAVPVCDAWNAYSYRSLSLDRIESENKTFFLISSF